MRLTVPSLAPRLLRWLGLGICWLLCLAVALLLFSYHAQLCVFPYQLMPAEAGLYQSVRALALGWNPWAPEHAMDYFNTYGIGYPWLVLQLGRLAPATDLLLLMRLTTAGAIFVGLASIFLALRDAGARALESAACCLAVYGSLLYAETPLAMPAGAMVALYTAALLLALRPGTFYAALAGGLAAASFFFKPQGLLGVLLVAVSLWIQGRRRDALASLVAAALAWAAVAGLLLWRYPYYFEGTVLYHLNASHPSLPWMLIQWGDLLAVHAPLWLAALAASMLAAKKAARTSDGMPALWLKLAALVFVVLALGPGAHVGAFMTYYDQLFVPLALVGATLWLLQLGLSRPVLALLLLLDAGAAWQFAAHDFPVPTMADAQAWARMDAWVQAHPLGLYPPILSTVVVKDRAFLTDTEHSHHLSECAHVGTAQLFNAYEAKMKTVSEALAQGRFQTVVCGSPSWPCPQHLKELGYHEAQPFYIGGGQIRFSVFVK
jgi:hypothetical protein